VVQQGPDTRQRLGQFLGVGPVTGIDVMAKTEAVVAVHHIAQPYLPQVVAALLVVSTLGQFVPRIGAGHIGVEVGRIGHRRRRIPTLSATGEA